MHAKLNVHAGAQRHCWVGVGRGRVGPWVSADCHQRAVAGHDFNTLDYAQLPVQQTIHQPDIPQVRAPYGKLINNTSQQEPPLAGCTDSLSTTVYYSSHYSSYTQPPQ